MQEKTTGSASGLERSEKKRNGKTNVVNALSKYPSIPLPLDYGVASDSYSHKGERYIPFIGRNDNLPNILFEARFCSVTQDSCIKNIVAGTLGKGLQIKGVELSDIKNQVFKDFLSQCNNEGDSFNSFLKDVLDTFKQDGTCFIEVIRISVGKLKTFKLYKLNNLYTRFGPVDAKTGRPNTVIVSKSFGKKGGMISQPGKPLSLPLYNEFVNDSKRWKQTAPGEYRTVLYFRNKVSGIDFYGIPDSYSSIKHQIAEGKSVQYNLDMFENGMVLSGAIVFKSAMTQDEANENARSIITSYTGDGKQGRIAVIASENGIEDFEFIKYETQKDGSFKDLEMMSESKIINSHGWAKEFTGTLDKGGLNKGGEYLMSLWYTKDTTILKPYRQMMMEKVVNPVMRLFKEWINDKEVNDFEFELVGEMPFTLLGDLDANSFVKRKEARSMAGLSTDETDKREEEYLVTTKKKEDVQS